MTRVNFLTAGQLRLYKPGRGKRLCDLSEEVLKGGIESGQLSGLPLQTRAPLPKDLAANAAYKQPTDTLVPALQWF